jgi:hypothetical protein
MNFTFLRTGVTDKRFIRAAEKWPKAHSGTDAAKLVKILNGMALGLRQFPNRKTL